MQPASDHSAEVIFNNALRIAAGDLADIHPRIQNQLLADCMLDDMSDLNFDDHAVKIFIEMIAGGKEVLTVGKLREEVLATFKENTEFLVAKDWNNHNNVEDLSELCARRVDLKHLNQLLIYIGGKSLNSSYQMARKTAPVYEKDSEHHGVLYSIGLNHCSDEADPQGGVTAFEYRSTNLMKLMGEARYIIEDELAKLIECSDIIQRSITIKDVIIYMNDIEILSFSYDLDVFDLYMIKLDLHSRLSEAKNIVVSDNFKEMLFGGKIFGGDKGQSLRQSLKGRMLESSLGM
jgi:hypothetical protein